MKVKQIVNGLGAAARGLLDHQTDGNTYRSKAGKIVRCLQCENVRFGHRCVSFHTSGDSLVLAEWAAPEVHALVCLACSRIEWFYLEPEQVDVEEQS